MSLLEVSIGNIKTFGYNRIAYVKLNHVENDNIYEMFLVDFVKKRYFSSTASDRMDIQIL